MGDPLHPKLKIKWTNFQTIEKKLILRVKIVEKYCNSDGV